MNTVRWPSIKQLAILAALLTSCLAQPHTSTPRSGSCYSQYDVNEPVNATGSRNIHWKALMMDPARNDWTLSLTFNATCGSNDTLYQWDSYLSTPEMNEAKACTFMFAGLNKTASSAYRNGCDGVVDEACTAVLGEISNIGGDCTWPTPLDQFTDRLRQACGAEFADTRFQTYRKYFVFLVRSQLTTITDPTEFANRDPHCGHSQPRGSTPQGDYRTLRTGTMSISETNENSDSNIPDYEGYDVYMRQTVPIVVAAEFFGGVGETQVMCLVPDEIAVGSRIPTQRSSATASYRVTTKSMGLLLMTAVVVVTCMI